MVLQPWGETCGGEEGIVAERAWWYDDGPAESQKYARAARRSRPFRTRAYLLPALILVVIVAASLFVHGGLLNPKTTCTTTSVSGPGVVSVHTQCRQERHFP